MNRKAISTESTASSVVRCAIYTRKSTEEGLEQEFNSLDAQRESAEAYIKSQQHEGWICLPDRYDDGGFTGGNMERPALRRLMADIEAGRLHWPFDKPWPLSKFHRRSPSLILDNHAALQWLHRARFYSEI